MTSASTADSKEIASKTAEADSIIKLKGLKRSIPRNAIAAKVNKDWKPQNLKMAKQRLTLKFTEKKRKPISKKTMKKFR